ncbi:MAG: CCA tRNA nucleotidyltransferase [Actinomycetota bacterium]
MEIIDRIRGMLPREILELLEESGSLAEEAGVRVYLVGGIVRDLLMDRPNLDIDLVIDGDGPAYAALLADRKNGNVVMHDRFGTSVVMLPGKRRVDVATARTETYETGGALPKVEFGPIEADLDRRDFSINAMAVSLNKGNFGELLDYFEGIEDIKKKRVRVLHHGSFIDDPTRIFRAVRFEQRFGFRMTKETEKLVKAGVEDDLLRTISGARIRNEIMAIFDEKDAAAAVERLEEFGVWNALAPGLHADTGTMKLFREIVKAENELKPGLTHVYKRSAAFLKALLSPADKDVAEAFGCLINLSQTRQKEILAAMAWAPEACRRLENADLSASAVWEELHGKTNETLVYVYAMYGAEVRRNVKRFMEIRKTKPLINGNDLVAMGYQPSALFAGVLKEVLKAQLDGKVSTREAEREMASSLLKDA